MSNLTLGGEDLSITKEQEEKIREILKSDEEFKKGDEYWYLGSDGYIYHDAWNDANYNKALLNLGNIFHTEAEVLTHKEYLLALQKIKQYIKKHDLGKEWVTGAGNYYVYWASHNKVFDWGNGSLNKQPMAFSYLKSQEACTQLIQALPEELKIVFGVK